MRYGSKVDCWCLYEQFVGTTTRESNSEGPSRGVQGLQLPLRLKDAKRLEVSYDHDGLDDTGNDDDDEPRHRPVLDGPTQRDCQSVIQHRPVAIGVCSDIQLSEESFHVHQLVGDGTLERVHIFLDRFRWVLRND